jgi:CubicO group peptidase (beta-lactamase class C family)
MRRAWLSWVAFLCLLGSAMGQTPAPLDSVNRYITAEIERQRIPGISVAILRNDQVLLSRGYGFANLELRVPASDSTIYQSGSLGKQFTAAAIAMLAEQGELSLDDSIVKWLPEGAGVWDGITVRHLLTHTSGIAEYTDSTFDYRRDYTEDQLLRFAASRPLDFPPGRRWSYSNTGYATLGVLIHRVTGRFYGEVLHDFLFAPIGMRTTRIISEADIVPNRAAGYQLVGGQIKNQDWVAPTLNTTADGSLYLSVNDLVRWAVALNHRRIPSAPVLARAWAPVHLSDGGEYPYGFGWDLTEQRGHPRIGHTGSWQGFKTALYRYPEYGLTVIVLANLAQAEAGAIAEGIAGMFQPGLQPPQLLSGVLSGPRPPTTIAALVAGLADETNANSVTPGLRSFLSPAARKDLGALLSKRGFWTELGCDQVGGRKMTRLGASIEHICYARRAEERSGDVVSVYYTKDWRAANLDTATY